MKIVTGVCLSIALVLCASLGLRSFDRGGVAQAADNITLQGTGATFPAPLYQKWFAEYNKLHPEVQINYQALGSGAGVKQFQQGLVNFGASDSAMTDEEMKKVKDGVVLLPMTAGSIVLSYNLPGVTDLKLSRAAYTGIFLGKIKQWDDPVIAKANPGVKLPSTPITVVTRSDGSGTTYVFTTHLSAISPEWKAGPGAGKSVNFPVGVAGKGNPGVTALDQADSRRDWLCRIWLRQANRHADGGAGESQRKVRQGRPRESARTHSPRCNCRPTCAPGFPIPQVMPPTRSSPIPGCFATKSTTIRRSPQTIKSRGPVTA